MTESQYKIKDVIQWDVKNWAGALNFWENHTALDFTGLAALDLGARDGGLSLWLALKGCEVICSDIDGPSDKAKSLHSKYGVSDSIKYEKIDALDIPYRNQFDIVILKSVLGGIGANSQIEKQKRTIEQIHKVLKPGGKFLFAENLIASPLHQYLRKKFLNWGKRWQYISIDEMKSFLDIFESYQYFVSGFLGSFGRNEWQRAVFGGIDRLSFDYVLPEKWHYIMIGLAVKKSN